MNCFVCPHCKRVWYADEKMLVIPLHTEHAGDFVPTTPPDVKKCITSGTTVMFDRNKYGVWYIKALFVIGVVCTCRLAKFIEELMRAMP